MPHVVGWVNPSCRMEYEQYTLAGYRLPEKHSLHAGSFIERANQVDTSGIALKEDLMRQVDSMRWENDLMHHTGEQ